MFTLQQIKAAHARVKSGSDFPAYVQEIKQLGLQSYEFMVEDGRTVYRGANGYLISSEKSYNNKAISPQGSPVIVQKTIADHQQGKNDFATFCQVVAEAGVEKWVVDTRTMLCSYYDLSGNCLVAEPIPEAGY